MSSCHFPVSPLPGPCRAHSSSPPQYPHPTPWPVSPMSQTGHPIGLLCPSAQHLGDGDGQGLWSRTFPDPRCPAARAGATLRCLASVFPFAPRFLHLGCNLFPPSLHLLMETIYNQLIQAA